MAMVNRNPAWARQEEALRGLDLNTIIPMLWPEAQGPRSDGGRWMQWHFPNEELKINVAPDGKGFVAWDCRSGSGRINSRGPSTGTYAAMLVQAVEGRPFPDAIQRLKSAGMLAEGFIAQPSSTQKESLTMTSQSGSGAFRYTYDYSRPYLPVRNYLVGMRGIPEWIVKAAWDAGQIQKGYGPINQHYVLFPCRDWSQDDTTPHGPKAVGALKRWMDPTPPNNPDYTKMAMPGTNKKAGWWQFSQDNSPKDIVVITEQPIDALSVMAAAQQLGQPDQIAVIGFGGQGGVTEKLVSTGTHIIIATDHDRAGVGYAQDIEQKAHRLPSIQSVTRCLPPQGQDWNEWWKADPQAATQALKDALDAAWEHAKDPNPFALHQRISDLDR